ncbi:uncharacterized protein E0L32_004023 [Thyridium curvatum]|uniref:Uncharacterized protein n=1 Tax=Thyridium curvatum TaxID=1093900 RepID=A0A507BCI4_9PEZI|nr:uncharacterized protein E0L32_004023 [Thyridium curvatum]TPX16374.1 hypothetical protein E0L32_004023 [Thyridium curvatum]
MSDSTPAQYVVDPSANPHLWPGPDQARENIVVNRVDVVYININGESDFMWLRTGTDEHVHHAVLQVAKHVARGLYRIVSMNVSDFSCMVIISTGKKREELKWKHGFPWDREDDPQPDVVLKSGKCHDAVNAGRDSLREIMR